MIPTYEGEKAIQQLATLTRIGSASCDRKTESQVAAIIEQVRNQGDAAIRELAKTFGDPLPETFAISQSAIAQAKALVKQADQAVMRKAAERITSLGQAVMKNIKPVSLDYAEFSVGIQFSPVARAACYVPSGRYPLPSTALMTALTARAAGVEEICILCPKPSAEIIFAATLAGVTEIYQIGGAQAIAAAAFGTESIKAADIIAGPGNSYVMEAKRQLQGTVGIDMLAGPSEIVIVADAVASPQWLALDLLSQMEHGPDSRAYLLTDSSQLAISVQQEIDLLAKNSHVSGHLIEAISGSAIFVLDSILACTEAVNRLAPEHVCLHVRQPEAVKGILRNYGALFVGINSTVPYGDYMSGANHTLPTNRCARFSGALTPLTFLRPQSCLTVPARATELSSDTIRFAGIEGLNLHAAAARARISEAAAVQIVSS